MNNYYLADSLSARFVNPNSYMTNNLATAFNSVPVGNFFPQGNVTQGSFGVKAQDAVATQNNTQKTTQPKIERLSLEERVEAREDADEYPVTDAHMAKAEDFALAAKDILSKDGDDISSEEWSTLERIFYEVKKDPRMTEAFLQISNDMDFSKSNDNTTTLLGSYESALIEKNNDFGNGKYAEDAVTKVNSLKAELKKNVVERNEDVWSDFDAQHNADRGHTDDSFVDTFKRKRESIITGGILGGAAGVGGTLLAAGAINAWNPGGWALLAIGGVATAAGALFGSKK